MVKAIYNGVNNKENCIHYIKVLAEQEKEEIEAIHLNNVRDQEVRDEKIHLIIEQFDQLNNGIVELSKVRLTKCRYLKYN